MDVSRHCYFIAVLVLAAGTGAYAAAEEQIFSTGKESWTVTSTGTLASKDWPIESALQLQYRKKTQTPKKAPVGEKAGPAGSKAGTAKDSETKAGDKPKSGSAAKADGGKADDKPPALPELVYGSSRSVFLLGAAQDADGKSTIEHTTQRSLWFDEKRRAIRVLDVITNARDSDLDITLSYITRWRPEIVPGLTQVRAFDLDGELASPPAEGPKPLPTGYLMTSRDPKKLPVLMFVLGAQPKDWSGALKTTPDELIWEYAGRLAARQRLVLLHWLVLRDDVRRETLLGTMDELTTDAGLPDDASMGAQVLKELANYPIKLPQQVVESDPFDKASPKLPLHRVKALAEAHKITRAADTDHLVLVGGTLLKGRFEAADIHLRQESGAEAKLLARDDIAAVSSLGMGARALVYLRDGSVLQGTLAWKEGAFVSDTLGTLKLPAESPGTLVMRSTDADGIPPAGTLAWLGADSGALVPLRSLPGQTLHIRWMGGHVDVPWAQVRAILPQEDGGTAQVIHLTHGTSIRGWCDAASLATLAGSAGVGESFLAMSRDASDLIPTAAPKETEPKPPFCLTSEGSVWQFSETATVIPVQTASAQVELPLDKITVIQRREGSNGTPLFEFSMKDGATLAGRPISTGIQVPIDSAQVMLPWHFIDKVRSFMPPDTGPPAPSADGTDKDNRKR